MGLFSRRIIEPTKERILDKKEDQTTSEQDEPEEPDDGDAICIKCKHHKEDDNGHSCYAQANKIKEYVTGEESWEDVEDCADINEDGDCSDFERI